jgi:hypothetical protein
MRALTRPIIARCARCMRKRSRRSRGRAHDGHASSTDLPGGASSLVDEALSSRPAPP